MITRLIFIAVAACAILLACESNAPGQEMDELTLAQQEAQQLFAKQEYAQALPEAVKALNLSIDKFGPEDKVTADCLTSLGSIFKELGQYTNAQPLLRRALSIRRKAYGREHFMTGQSLSKLGSLYGLMGEYAKAEPLLLHALTISEKAFGSGSVPAGLSMSELGGLYQHLGDYSKAQSYDEQSVAILQKELGPDNLKTAVVLNNLAVVFMDTDDYAKAEPMLQQALATIEKVLGSEAPQTAMTMTTLGMLYHHVGDYAKAESLYQRALAFQEKNPGPEHPDTAKTLNALSMLYTSMGDFEKALPLCQRALKIQEKILPSDHPDLAGTLGNLGLLYEKLGKFAQAELTDLRVLSIDEISLGPDCPDTAKAVSNLGELYSRMGDLTKAESFDKRAVEIWEKTVGPDNPELAGSLNNLAVNYRRMGDLTNAEALLSRALAIDDKSGRFDDPVAATRLGNLAYVYFDLQKTNEALQLADRAERSRLLQLNNILSFTSEQERLNYEVLDDSCTLFGSLNDAPRVAQAILRHKGVVLDSLLEDRLVAQASGTAEDRALIAQLVPARQQLTQLLMSVPKDSKPETLKSRAESRDHLSRQVEKLETALAQKVAGIGHARRALTSTVADVQKAIPPQTALVEIIRYRHYLGRMRWEDRYGTAILCSSGDPKWAGLGAAEAIDQDVHFCQQLVRDKKGQGEDFLPTVLHELYGKVWAPVQKLLPPNTRNIVISPDGSLNFASFAVLLTPKNRFLAEDYSIRYVASGRDLMRAPVKSPSQDMVIFAAPDYAAGGKIDWPETGVQLAPLPYLAKNATALEAEARRWGWPVQVYSGVGASESRLRTIHSPRILHFSTHGFFLPETMRGPARFSFLSWLTDAIGFQQQVTLKNPMYRSGIALAGAQVTLDAWKRGETPPTDADGILTAEEAGGLDLQGTWLVVLAECDTGIGEPRSGEGVMGLRRGFAQAGAQNLLMTLWPVFDVSSGELMLDFYAALHQNDNPADALAKVQRTWLVKLRSKYGLLPAVVMAGAFILNSQGPST